MERGKTEDHISFVSFWIPKSLLLRDIYFLIPNQKWRYAQHKNAHEVGELSAYRAVWVRELVKRYNQQGWKRLEICVSTIQAGNIF